MKRLGVVELVFLLVLSAGAGANVTVTSTSPASGAIDVPANTTQFRIQFSGPVRTGGWSMTTRTDRGEPVEFAGKPTFSDNNTVAIWPMKLKPGTKYAVGINSTNHQNWRSAADGSPVTPHLVVFSTAGEADSAASSTGAEVHVVSTYPANGADNVTAGDIKLRFRFSSAVNTGGYSLVNVDQGTPVPFTGKPTFEENGLVCIAPAKLKPGTKYAVSVNSNKHNNFRSAADGTPVTPYLLIFTTKGERADSAPKDRDTAWREDLAYFARELPARHKNLFFQLSKTDFDKAVSALGSKIPSMTDGQIGVELMKLTARVGDEHTGIAARIGYT